MIVPPLGTTIYDAAGWNALAGRPGWTVALVSTAVAAIALAIAFGWRERRIARRGAVGLLALRLTAIAGAISLVLGIERRTLTEIEEPSRVVLLVDRSASMTLPASSDVSASPKRDAAVASAIEPLAQRLANQHRVRQAGFDVAVEYEASDVASNNEARGNGGATRMGEAIRRVLSDHATTPLAAVFVASDGGWNSGADPLEAIAPAIDREVPIHTLGIGPLREPPSVGLRDLAAPSRAATDDGFRVRVTLATNAAASLAGGPHRVRITLRLVGEDDSLGDIASESEVAFDPLGTDLAEGGLASDAVELDGLSAGEYEIAASLTPAGPDADPTDNELRARIEFIDRPTRVLLAAGGPSRDYRFLRDSLYRDDLFTCDVLLQTATGAVTQDAGQVLAALPATPEEWEAYDALVAVDLDWRVVDPKTLEAAAEWVSKRGAGVVFLAGPVATPSVVRSGLASPLRTLLPVRLRDDPLGFGSAATREASPVRVASAGADYDWLTLPAETDEASNAWSLLPGFYSPTLPAEPKPGATVLVELGDGSDTRPLFVEQLYGAGRVVYGAAAETWRLRQVDPATFTALHVGLLRHVTQGRLLGADAAGGLLFDRQQYDVGDTMTVRFLAREATAATTGGMSVRLLREGADAEELRLSMVEDQPGTFAVTIGADAVGRHVVAFLTPSGERLTASAEVVLPELEQETRVQNVSLLQEIAERTGGQYVDLSDAASATTLNELADETMSRAETEIELGPPDEAFAKRLSRVSLAVMAGALLLEWTLRRAWRLA